MSVHVSSAVWRTEFSDPIAKFILVKLADNANDEGSCWPSLTTICLETGICRTTVCEKLKMLESSGVLKRERRGYCSTIYTFQKKFFGLQDTTKWGSAPDVLPSAGDRLPSAQDGLGVVRQTHRNRKLKRYVTIKNPSLPDRAKINVGKRADETPNSIYSFRP